MKSKLLSLLLIAFFSSCDYFTDQKVRVIDKSNMKPVKGATVLIAAYEFNTDSSGFCHMSQVTGDLTERTIQVFKDGYKDFTLQIELGDNSISYKQKLDSTYSVDNSFAVLADTLVVYLERL